LHTARESKVGSLRKSTAFDRTPIKHLKRIDPDRAGDGIWQAKRGKAPRQIAAAQESQGAEIKSMTTMQSQCGDRQ
jgi:hypothetical protein